MYSMYYKTTLTIDVSPVSSTQSIIDCPPSIHLGHLSDIMRLQHSMRIVFSIVIKDLPRASQMEDAGLLMKVVAHLSLEVGLGPW